MHTLGPYDGGLDRLVRTFKFDREPAVGRWLGERMADIVAHAVDVRRFEVVTFVPMTWQERRARTFNQAEILARTVSRRLGLPLCKLLIKTRRTRPQSRLPARARRINVRDAFRVRHVGGEGAILLVDDVCTTGATVEACAMALRRAGHLSVVVLTAARA